MNSSKTTQYKGIDKLDKLDENLGTFQSCFWLILEKMDLSYLLKPPSKIELLGQTPATIEAAKKKNRIDNATLELTLLQYTSGEVRDALTRNLKAKRGSDRDANGKQAWEALEEIFQGAGCTNKHVALNRIFDWKFSSPATKTGLSHGLVEFENMASRLAQLNCNLDDDVLGIKLANALPKESTACQVVYTHCMQMEKPTVRSVSVAIEQLIGQLDHEEHLHGEHAMQVHEPARSGDKTKVLCDFCKKMGWHHASQCFQNPESDRYKGKKSTPAPGSRAHVDKAIRAYNVAQTKAKAKAKKRRSQTATKTQSRYQINPPSDEETYYGADESSSDYNSDNEKTYEYACLINAPSSFRSASSHDKWIADSGATSHMTHSSIGLYDIQTTVGDRVRVGNGCSLDILCKGSLNFLNKQGKRITLFNVLYVPGLDMNLISIGKLQKRNLTTTFPGLEPGPSNDKNKNYVFIKTRRGKRFLSACLEDSLYRVELSRLPIEQAFPAETLEMLHQRLGHISMKKIKMMKSTLLSQKIEIKKDVPSGPCMGCVSGKLHRENYRTTRLHPASEALEVIHTDISGPYTTSKKGSRWLIIFVDEFTRLMTSYCIKRKSDSLTCFKEYRALMENDRKLKIQTMEMSSTTRDHILRLQTDGGGEYTSTAFEKYLETAGIAHFSSCADSPSQNGMAERYIRTVTEAALSMLSHAKLNASYWPYAMRTATYLLNRTPKSVLSNISPYEMWTGTTPDLRSLRTFGVDAHVRVVTQNKRKGAPISHHCIFLGYKEGIKGYVFEDTRTKRIITNGDATFYEGDWIVNGVKRFDFSTKHTPSIYPTFPSPVLPKTNEGTEMNSNIESESSGEEDFPSPPITRGTMPVFFTTTTLPVITQPIRTELTAQQEVIATLPNDSTQATTPEPLTQQNAPLPAETTRATTPVPSGPATLQVIYQPITAEQPSQHPATTPLPQSPVQLRPRRSGATYTRNYSDSNLDMFRMPPRRRPSSSNPKLTPVKQTATGRTKRGRNPNSPDKNKKTGKSNVQWLSKLLILMASPVL